MNQTTQKKKSLFRKEAFILIGFIAVLLILYFTIFFAWHLKWVTQRALTKIYGAEVNISSVEVNYLPPGLLFRNFQFTNHQKPTHNLFELGEVSLKLNTNDLMFASLVAEEAKIAQVRIDRKRKRVGFVSAESQKLISLSLDLKENKKAVINKKTSGNILENAMSFSKKKDLDAELKNILKDLNTEAMSKKYTQRLKVQNEIFEDYKNSLDKAELQKIETKVASLKKLIEQKGSPVQVLALGTDLLKDIKSKKDKISTLNTQVKNQLSDLKKVKTDFKEDLSSIKSGIKNKFKIPDISPKSLAKDFFAETVSTRFYLFKYWIEQIRKNSEDKIKQTTSKVLTESQRKLVSSKVKKTLEASKKEKAIKKNIADAKLKNAQYISFGNSARPKFWMKKVLISGDSKANQDLQNFTGKILNISDNQFLINKPIEITFKGDLPKENFYDLKINALLNHHVKELNEVFDITATYPISSFKIVDDNSLKVYLKKAISHTKINGSIQKSEVRDMVIKNSLDKVNFDFYSSKSDINKWLEPIFTSISDFNMDIFLDGPLRKPNLKILSSLADQVSKGLKNQVASQLAEFNSKIEKKISEETENLRSKVFSKIDTQQENIDKILSDLRQKLDSRNVVVNKLLSKSSSSKLGTIADKVGSKLTDKLFGKPKDKKSANEER